MNVIILGENGVCTHGRDDVLDAFKQIIASTVDVGPATVAVILTDDFDSDSDEVDLSFVKQALLRALLQLEEGN